MNFCIFSNENLKNPISASFFFSYSSSRSIEPIAAGNDHVVSRLLLPHRLPMLSVSVDTVPVCSRDSPSHVSWASSNALVGWHTGSGRTPGNHGQPEGLMRVLSCYEYSMNREDMVMPGGGDEIRQMYPESPALLHH
jgi:hypothetical protein